MMKKVSRSQWGYPMLTIGLFFSYVSIVSKLMKRWPDKWVAVNDNKIAYPENNNDAHREEPRVHYSILTMEHTLRAHPERRQNVERTERDFPQFDRDIAIDASTDYEEINRIFQRHNVTCDKENVLSLGASGLWASTLRRWDWLIDEGAWDFAVILEDDHIYDEKIDKQITKMVQNRWKYFRGENSLPMYSFGHGDGINLYTVSALPRLIAAFHDNFGKRQDNDGTHPYKALDAFYDRLGLATENMNFAWSRILPTHENSTLNNMHLRNDTYEIKCSPDGKFEKRRRDIGRLVDEFEKRRKRNRKLVDGKYVKG